MIWCCLISYAIKYMSSFCFNFHQNMFVWLLWIIILPYTLYIEVEIPFIWTMQLCNWVLIKENKNKQFTHSKCPAVRFLFSPLYWFSTMIVIIGLSCLKVFVFSNYWQHFCWRLLLNFNHFYSKIGLQC